MKNKYFIFDTGNLCPQGMDNVRLKVCPIVKDREHNPMFTEEFFADKPKRWEVRYDNGYPNIIYDPEYRIYRAYYTLCSLDTNSARTPEAERRESDYHPEPGRIASLGYAESQDGVRWFKPELGLTEFEGSKENNMIFRYAHGTGVFLDEEERDRSRRYKMVTKVAYPGGFSYMAVNFSEDGIHWGNMIPWPKYNPPADCHNFAFRDKKDGKFKLITRLWKNGVRTAALSESTDFLNWSDPVEILRGDGLKNQVYSMPVFQYEGLYLGLASIFHEGNRSEDSFDTVDCEWKFATDCRHFDSVAKGQSVIPRGEGRYPDGSFDCGCIYAAVPIEKDDRWYIYYMGGNGHHSNFRRTSLGRGYLEKDKLAYFEQEKEGLEAILPTADFHIYGEDVRILADMAEGGSLKAAVYDKWNHVAYDGFDFEDCRILKDEKGWYRLKFSKDYLSLGTAPACLMLRFSGCRVYAIGGELQNISKRY